MMFRLTQDALGKIVSRGNHQPIFEISYIFRFNTEKKELHILIEKDGGAAFYKVSEWINSKKKIRFKDDATGKLFEDAHAAIKEAMMDPVYAVFGCTKIKEVMTIFKEYGI